MSKLSDLLGTMSLGFDAHFPESDHILVKTLEYQQSLEQDSTYLHDVVLKVAQEDRAFPLIVHFVDCIRDFLDLMS